MMNAALIPLSVFERIPPGHEWALFAVAAVAIGLLVVGASRAVDAAARLAATAGMSKVIIGATVVSIGTTMPEACTSVFAALTGKPGLALGNGVGSIICDTGLIFGLGLLLGHVPRSKFVLLRHGMLKIAAGVLLTATIFGLAWRAGAWQGAEIPRVVGIGFLVLLAGYLCVSVRWARQRPEIIPKEAEAEAQKIVTRAQQEAVQIRAGADQYAEVKLRDLGEQVVKLQVVIENGLNALHSRRTQEKAEPQPAERADKKVKSLRLTTPGANPPIRIE